MTEEVEDRVNVVAVFPCGHTLSLADFDWDSTAFRDAVAEHGVVP